MTDWQLIETAPRDGSEFLAYGFYIYPGDTARTEYMAVVEYDETCPECPWSDLEGNKQNGVWTHWMLLPDPPENK